MKTKIIIALFLIATLNSCKKTIITDHTNDITGATYYLKGSLNGTLLTWKVTDDLTNYVSGTSSRTSYGQGISIGYFGGMISKLGETFYDYYPQISFEFGTTKVNFDDDFYAYLKSFLTTGRWNYASTLEPVEGTKSIIVNYTDKTGKEYDSIGTQIGSVQVTNVTPLPAEYGRKDGLKVKLTFSCKLYPKDGTGNVLSFTDGEALVRVESNLY